MTNTKTGAVQVTEIQDRNTTRVYTLTGPQVESVRSFWEYLKDTKVIQSYEIEEI
jgi:hypothetical protein